MTHPEEWILKMLLRIKKGTWLHCSASTWAWGCSCSNQKSMVSIRSAQRKLFKWLLGQFVVSLCIWTYKEGKWTEGSAMTVWELVLEPTMAVVNKTGGTYQSHANSVLYHHLVLVSWNLEQITLTHKPASSSSCELGKEDPVRILCLTVTGGHMEDRIHWHCPTFLRRIPVNHGLRLLPHFALEEENNKPKETKQPGHYPEAMHATILHSWRSGKLSTVPRDHAAWQYLSAVSKNQRRKSLCQKGLTWQYQVPQGSTNLLGPRKSQRAPKLVIDTVCTMEVEVGVKKMWMGKRITRVGHGVSQYGNASDEVTVPHIAQS